MIKSCSFFRCVSLKAKSPGKRVRISLDLLIQPLGRHAVNPRQIGIKNHALSANLME